MFFFKQKTAYEILACSDVCSSDLRARRREPALPVRVRPAARYLDAPATAAEPTPTAARLRNRPPRGRSQKRRVGKECRSRWSPHNKKKISSSSSGIHINE